MTKKKMTSTTDPVGTTGDAPALVHADPVGPSPRVVGILSNPGLNQTKTNVMSDVGIRSSLGLIYNASVQRDVATISNTLKPLSLGEKTDENTNCIMFEIYLHTLHYCACNGVIFKILLTSQQNEPQPTPWILLHPMVKLQQAKEKLLCTSQTAKPNTSKPLPLGKKTEESTNCIMFDIYLHTLQYCACTGVMCKILLTSQQNDPQPTPWILLHRMVKQQVKESLLCTSQPTNTITLPSATPPTLWLIPSGPKVHLSTSKKTKKNFMFEINTPYIAMLVLVLFLENSAEFPADLTAAHALGLIPPGKKISKCRENGYF